MSDRDWMSQAACVETDPDLFFPDDGISARDALRVCAGCPVQAQCLNYAIENEFIEGVWGNKPARQRRKKRTIADPTA